MNSYKIEASFETLMEQASSTTEDYLTAAIKMIDNKFGTGYAKANPSLVGDIVKASAKDFETSCFMLAHQLNRA